VPWPRRLLAGFTKRRYGLNYISGLVGFVVGKEVLKEVHSVYVGSPSNSYSTNLSLKVAVQGPDYYGPPLMHSLVIYIQ
jgi:hypothetical protein